MKHMLLLVLLFFSAGMVSAQADTLYLKNGHRLEGLVVKESPDGIEFNVGGGVVFFSTAEIARMERATPEEVMDLTETWAKKQERARKVADTAMQERQRSLDEWKEKWDSDEPLRKAAEAKRLAEEEAKRKAEAGTGAIALIRDSKDHLFVNARLNDSADGVFMVDTGAPVSILTLSMAGKLGLTPESPGHRVEVMLLNGKHKAIRVKIKSIRLNSIEVNDVMMDMLIEEDPVLAANLKDGVFGLSVLDKLHVTIDQKNAQMLIRAVEP